MSATQSSPLLQCLSQLNDDTWAEVLLPKLVQQGSAQNVAATCTQLRDLCFRTVQTVMLRGLDAVSFGAIDAWLAPLPAQFPNCTTLAICVCSEQDYPKMPHLLPALARLPKFSDLRLYIAPPAQPTPLAMLLGNMRTCLTGLQALALGLGEAWPKAQAVWQALACYTQLTSLSLEYNIMVKSPIHFPELAPLRQLSHLLIFQVIPHRMPRLLPPAEPATTSSSGWLQCLAGMTALTQLFLAARSFGGLHIVSACSALSALDLIAFEADTTLADEDWEAVGKLTALTSLSVNTQDQEPAPAACYAVLQRLTRLQELGLSGLTEKVLPVLQELTCVTKLSGNWLAALDAAARDSCSCPHVEELDQVSGPVPLVAFPKLRLVAQIGTLPLDTVAALVHHCQDLQEFWVTVPDITHFGHPTEPGMTLPFSEPVAARVAAVKRFAKLPKLSVLGLKPCTNQELAAFVEVVQQLQQKQLRRAGVAGLMLLGQLSGLERLDIRDSTPDSMLLDDPGPLLCALRGVNCLQFHVCKDAVFAVQETLADLSAQGLSVPGSVLTEALCDM